MIERKVTCIEGGVGYGHSTFTELVKAEFDRLGVDTVTISPLTDAGLEVRMAWRLAENMYKWAGKSEGFRYQYEKLRSGNDGQSLRKRTVRDLERIVDKDSIVLSDHAYAAMRGGNLLQGDVYAGCSYAFEKHNNITVFVPLSESRKEIVSFGHDEGLIHEVGFFVPNELKNPEAKELRRSRIRSGSLHVTYMTSGAHPTHHINLLRSRILPNLAHLMKQDSQKLKVSVYLGTNKSVAMKIVEQGINLGIPTTLNNDDTVEGRWGLRVLYSETRRDGIRSTGSIAAASDLVITMGNERTGYVGEGLPLALLMPIGINAKENTRFLVENHLALPPGKALRVDEFIQEQIVNKGIDLVRMQRVAERMYLPTDGARNTAEIISQHMIDQKLIS